jgi:hypothetical protein
VRLAELDPHSKTHPEPLSIDVPHKVLLSFVSPAAVDLICEEPTLFSLRQCVYTRSIHTVLVMAVINNSDINHGHFELVECIAFCVIIPVFVALRFLSRILVKQLGSDDWTALVAAVSALYIYTEVFSHSS